MHIKQVTVSINQHLENGCNLIRKHWPFACHKLVVLTLLAGMAVNWQTSSAMDIILGATAAMPTSEEPDNKVLNEWSGPINPKKIPLGDHKVSTSPKRGYVYSCSSNFRHTTRLHGGPWINHENGTWDSTAKSVVEGEIFWPTANFSEKIGDNTRILALNDLPEDHPTGIFPIQRTDPAYQYDTNPNHIKVHGLTYNLPLNPEPAATPHCMPRGPVGVLSSGVLLFNALDDAGLDAVAHETQDKCNGHPTGRDEYHYHNVPACIRDKAAKARSTLIGYALDGYGIYVEYDADGNLPTNADLDECHGRISEVMWNGVLTKIYHYSATLEYPYTVGCFHGTPIIEGHTTGNHGLNARRK